MALVALTLLVQQRLRHEVERYQDVVDLRVVPPCARSRCACRPFAHGSVELISVGTA
jgi:hypothetical protein